LTRRYGEKLQPGQKYDMSKVKIQDGSGPFRCITEVMQNKRLKL
jgi:hypothetical protein